MLAPQPKQHTPTVLLEDNHLLVLHKPAGMPVQADASGDLCLVDWAKGYLKAAYAKPGEVFAGLVHRLDRPVSGIVILTKTSKALTRLSEAFRLRTVEKIYLAMVSHAPKEPNGTLVDYLIKDSKTNTSKRVHEAHKRADRAELDYRTVQETADGYLLEVMLHTGRHHQIRVQLKGMGCPIVGDMKYGARAPYLPHAIMLHAHKVRFPHPVRDVMVEVVSAPAWLPA